MQISYSLGNIRNAVHQFWQYAHRYKVMAFRGEMGAGKTSFIHALCHMLGVEDAVSSPTFAIVNEYHFLQEQQDTTIYHMDWYRLNDAAEAADTGIDDYFAQPDAYIFVEWPEKAPDLLPRPYLDICIETLSPEERSLVVSVIK